MDKEETRGRKMRSDNVRVIPEFREHIDIEKLCQALIGIAKSISQEDKTAPKREPEGETQLQKSSFCKNMKSL